MPAQPKTTKVRVLSGPYQHPTHGLLWPGPDLVAVPDDSNTNELIEAGVITPASDDPKEK